MVLDSKGAITLQATYTDGEAPDAAARETGSFPLSARSRDSALVLCLNPGMYTAQVTNGTANASGQKVGENDDWGKAGDATAQIRLRQSVGAFPLPAGSKDAEMAITLNEGMYTVQVTGADGGGGTVLVEVYEDPAGL